MTNQLNRILLNHTAVDSSADPFAQETGTVDISFPILVASNYQCTIEKAELVDGKKTEGSKNIKVCYVTTQDGTSTKGDVVPAGVKLYQHVATTATGKLTIDMIKKSVTRLAKAAGLPPTTTVRQVIDTPSILEGKPVVVKVAVAQETTDFPERNEVKGLIIEG